MKDKSNLDIDTKNYKDDNYNLEERLLLNTYKKFFQVSAPLIPNSKEFFDIFRTMRKDDTVNYEIKYNPLGFGNKDYHFMYVNTLSDKYKPFSTLKKVKKYMSEDSIKRFETVNKYIENIKLIMNKLPVQFYSDKVLLNMLTSHYDKEPLGKLDNVFLKQVNDYVVREQKRAIRIDLHKSGLKPSNNIVDKILELNKINKTQNTIKDIKKMDFSTDANEINEILKEINKALKCQNSLLELEMW